MLRIQHKMYTTPRASPTLVTPDTHAREPRQSALSTYPPLRPSNYQSEDLRCPAARSVSTVQRATAEREQQPSARLQRHDVARRAHQISSWSFEPDRGRRLHHGHAEETFFYLLRLLSSDVEIASSSFRYASNCSWS